MVFQQCGALCPQVCDKTTACKGGCAEGCFCPDGQVVNNEGQCILAGTCVGMILPSCMIILLHIICFKRNKLYTFL